MSETLVSIHRLTPLADVFWRDVTVAPWRYDLFHLLRRIDAQGGERYPLGRAPLPKFESLRIGQTPSMGFAPATLASAQKRENSAVHEISILSFGLFGPNGPLPLHMTEYARERIHHHQDNSLSAFADLFHHRLTLLFYRAWADAQPTVSLDRTDNRRFERYLASLIGMGQLGQLEKGELSPHARFTHAGHLSRHSRDPEGLEKILRNYFKVPVNIISNVPQWMPLTSRAQAQLGAGWRLPRLGVSAFLGVAVRDVQHKFRLEIGPLSAAEYARFLPGEKAVNELRDWIRQYLGIEYAWDVRVLIRGDEVPGTVPCGSGKLGYSTWLGHQPAPAPRGDLVFSVEQSDA
ncbi:type VI secretion system baseplate subunit TssG [Salmonella enterica]|nr:type VI secretion system baseplate subunit TssG [Salmonella enterica subsp. enterica serovar Orientalis]EBJ4008986.1 type VI secretion system baseplate subunit TssG [Salmonella enterica]EBQ9235317.1 type VI secretion system baseplate subunit TssG [Salmonella enterica subsp. enterica serovar Orientalis]EKA1668081.1 type VI secretion system baseplate subunit TssG [Salmonella enterica]